MDGQMCLQVRAILHSFIISSLCFFWNDWNTSIRTHTRPSTKTYLYFKNTFLFSDVKSARRPGSACSVTGRRSRNTAEHCITSHRVPTLATQYAPRRCSGAGYAHPTPDQFCTRELPLRTTFKATTGPRRQTTGKF